MSETPLPENKIMSNDSGLLSGTYAYSPKIILPQQYPNKQESSSQADSIEKILSTSIQRAKQKISMLEGRPKEDRMDSKERAASKDGQTTTNAVAAAMKVLQSRVGQLQRSIEGHQRERTIIMKQIDNLSSEKKIILTNLQEANRKIVLLQSTVKHTKAQIKQLLKQLENAVTEKGQLSAKCQTLQMTIRHLESDKQQMSISMSRKEQEKKQSPSHKQIIVKATEIQERERMVLEKEKKINQKQHRLQQVQNILKQKENRISNQVNLCNKQNLKAAQLTQQNDRLQKQILELKLKKAEHHIDQNQTYEVYLKKISQMQNELQVLRQTTKNLTQPQQSDAEEAIDNLRQELKVFQGKYDQLVHLYRRSQEKCKREDSEVRSCRTRIRQLEDILSEILQKLIKLPNSPKDLKYLQVKAGKLLNVNIERISTLRTPTKSRSNSLNRSISKSNSQRKTKNALESSRNSKKSGGSSKKKEESGSKSKRVVGWSHGGWELLEKEVSELKKQYKKLVKMVNQSQNQQIRARLNQLVFQIHDKSEQITKIKQLHRIK